MIIVLNGALPGQFLERSVFVFASPVNLLFIKSIYYNQVLSAVTANISAAGKYVFRIISRSLQSPWDFHLVCLSPKQLFFQKY